MLNKREISKTKKKKFLLQSIFLVLVLFLIPLSYASDITLSLNQSEYYFGLEENANIVIEYENNYKDVEGIFEYTITQLINQGGFRQSSTNSQSQKYILKKGEDGIGINLGSAPQPIDIELSILYKYEDQYIELNDIKIHFIDKKEEEQEEQNQEQKEQEEGQESENQQQQNQEQQHQEKSGVNQKDPEKTPPPKNPDASTKMQNNQMQQDSSALKKEMQEQIEKQNAIDKKFQEELSRNEDFKKQHEELIKDGYNVTDGNINAENNNTGDFEINYEKDGRKANLKGNMNNASMENIQLESDEQKEMMEEKLRSSEEFQKFKEQLSSDGFNETDMKFTFDDNKTTLEVNYNNNNTNKTAIITAKFNKEELEEVKLEKSNQKRYLLWSMIIIGMIIIFIYLYKKNKKQVRHVIDIIKPKTIFNYKKEAKKILSKAKVKFEKKKYKDSYSLAAQSIRLYISYNNNLNKELTNDDIIATLRRKNMKYKEIKEAFDLCSLVEFAKYKANKQDFNKIVEIAEKNIKS